MPTRSGQLAPANSTEKTALEGWNKGPIRGLSGIDRRPEAKAGTITYADGSKVPRRWLRRWSGSDGVSGSITCAGSRHGPCSRLPAYGYAGVRGSAAAATTPEPGGLPEASKEGLAYVERRRLASVPSQRSHTNNDGVS